MSSTKESNGTVEKPNVVVDLPEQKANEPKTTAVSDKVKVRDYIVGFRLRNIDKYLFVDVGRSDCTTRIYKQVPWKETVDVCSTKNI